jgi:hypothetical protein
MKIYATATIVAALLALPACDSGDGKTTTESATDNTDTGSATDPATGTEGDTDTPTTGDDSTTEEPTTASGALSFAADVWAPILQPSCSCHQQGASGGLLMGTDAAAAYTAMVDVKSSSPLDYVEPGDSSKSYVFHKVSGTQGEAGGGGGQMPQGGMLDAADIATIKQWIDDGAEP